MYYLYIKIHKETGLKYLGKTCQNPFSYKGSGIRWSNHLKKYGNNVETIILFESENKEDIREKGIYYSSLWNIVKDDNWANLKIEEGDGGDTSNTPKYLESLKNRDYSKVKTQKYKQKMSQTIKKMWEEKFSSNEFDKDAFKKMCSERSKKMWDSRGVTDNDRIKRSKLQKEYIQKPGVKENLSKKSKDKWIIKSKLYEVTLPDGKKEIIKCLRGWCKENQLPYYKIYNTLRANRPSKEGWMVKIYEPDS
jgi:hypothetical protein